MESERALPTWVVRVCGTTSLLSIVVSILGIYLHLKNYRKPFEQRLTVRILAVVPLFALSCYLVLLDSPVGRVLEPIREIYEAFVIYTFYKLLVLMLGGERKIILMTVNKPRTSHPFPNSLILPKVNISDPQHFLTIKRCILQYVWMKPLLYLIISITTLLGVYDVNDISTRSVFVWLSIFYNLSVTISLYSLAMFWKCLYEELAPFNPWRKFMCVKLIIFASYWQGMMIGLLTWLGVFKNVDQIGMLVNKHGNLGIQIQNGLLCFEMIFFAWLHWNSFPYTDFTNAKFPDAARMKTSYAFMDWIRIGDLIHDLRISTMYGDNYNLRNFDSLSDSTVYNSSDTFNQKIYQGLRVSSDGKKYWINTDDGNSHDTQTVTSSRNSNESSSARKASIDIENQARVLKLASVKSSNNSKSSDKTPLLPTSSSRMKTYLSDIDELLGNEDSGLLFNESRSDNPYSTQFDDDWAKDEKLYKYVRSHVLSSEEINYPVEYEHNLVNYSTRIERLRETMM